MEEINYEDLYEKLDHTLLKSKKFSDEEALMILRTLYTKWEEDKLIDREIEGSYENNI